MTTTDYVVDILGGASVVRCGAGSSIAEMRERVGRGLPYQSLETLRERLKLSVPETASVLHMPLRTLARRRQARRLDAQESDRLYRVARIAAQAVASLGSEDRAVAWLHRPNRSLGGERPIRLLDTDIGARLVEDVLGRLEHGIVS